MKSYKIIQESEFIGMDACLQTSLFEYGLIGKYEGLNTYYFIYGIGHNGESYNVFDHCELTIDPKDIFNEYNWIEEDEKESFLSSIGFNEEDFLNLDLFSQICDLVNYYGYENIFGSTYWQGFNVYLQDEGGNIYDYEGNTYDNIDKLENTIDAK